MHTQQKQITIAVSVALQDAGEATRSLEIMKGIRDNAPDGLTVKAIFFSHGGKFEQNVIDNGFEIQHTTPMLEGSGFRGDLMPSANNFVGSPQLAFELLEGEISAIQECHPDMILHGFWPFASLARRMMNPPIPGVCFLPLPLEPTLYCSFLMQDVPDQIRPLTYLPVGMRRAIMKILPVSLKLKAPILRQQNILDAAQRCGWGTEPLNNLFDMMKADLTIVNDLEEFYKEMPIPSHFKITGPLYSPGDQNDKVDETITKLFIDQHKGKHNVFCTMGSSGSKDCLLEVIKAVAALPSEQFNAVVLVPKAVCPIDEIMPYVKGKTNLYLTDQFVPAKRINALADLVVCHGGQGTIQTALASGTPMVGVAMQPEQQINLDNAVRSGAGIRIPITRWNSQSIQSAIHQLVADHSFRANAERLGKSMSATNGQTESAAAIWKFLMERL